MNPASRPAGAANAAGTAPTAHMLQLPDLPELQRAQAAPGGELLPSMNPLHHIKAHLQVCVGQATLTVGELFDAREEQVILLDRRVDQPVDLLLEGKVIARGHLVAVGEHFAVRISELPVSLKG